MNAPDEALDEYGMKMNIKTKEMCITRETAKQMKIAENRTALLKALVKSVRT